MTQCWLATRRFAAAALVAVNGLSASQAGETHSQPFVPPTECGTPATITKSSIGFPEARANGSDSEAWALFFHPLSAKRRIKIVWRMAGRGQFRVTAYSPKGSRIEPETPPVRHTSSNWQRSGDEWGTWFQFPAAGCWLLHTTREGASANLWIEVN